MPPKALPYRAEQLAWLSGQAHRRFTASKVGELIAECEQAGFQPESDEAANVREWRRLYDRATKVPPHLVERLERTCAHAREAWREARKQSQFKLFKPHLDKILSLTRQMANCWGYAQSPYDALLDGYEPGATAGALGQTFSELRGALATVLPSHGTLRGRARGFVEGKLPGGGPAGFQSEGGRGDGV